MDEWIDKFKMDMWIKNGCIVLKMDIWSEIVCVIITFTNGFRSDGKTSISGLTGKRACPSSYASNKSKLTSGRCSK